MMRSATALAALLAGAGTALAQADAPAPADPVPAREMELDEPAPFTEGIELNFNPPQWLGVSLRTSFTLGDGSMDVARGRAIEDFGGARPPLNVTLDYEEREYDAFGIGIVSDYDLFRLSLDFYTGDFEGEAVLTVDDGIAPPTTQKVDVEGDFFAFRFEAYFPTLRARSGGWEVSFGPAVSAGLHLSEPESPAQAPIEVKDDISELIGTIGPRVTVRFELDGFYLSAEVEVAYLFSSTEGLMEEVSLGGGIRF